MGRRMRSRIAAVGLVAVLAGVIGICRVNKNNRSCTEQLFAMDTFMSFTAYGRECEEAVSEAVSEVKRLDALLSAQDTSSEVAEINRAKRGTLSEDTLAVFERAMDIYEETGGLFDFTIYPLMKLWGFPTREYHVPAEEEIQAVLPQVDASGVRRNGDGIVLGEEQEIDFGGIAKGYASSRIMEIFRSHGITSGMVSLGGNVQVLGRRPDQSRWQVGIQNPGGAQGEVLAVVEAEDQAVITSGGYERYFEENGNTYIHILDPRTGYPANGDLISVTVVSEDGTLADALSTSLYIMGYKDAVKYWQEHWAEFDMVLVMEQGELYVTEGLRDRFRSEEDYTILTKRLDEAPGT